MTQLSKKSHAEHGLCHPTSSLNLTFNVVPLNSHYNSIFQSHSVLTKNFRSTTQFAPYVNTVHLVSSDVNRSLPHASPTDNVSHPEIFRSELNLDISSISSYTNLFKYCHVCSHYSINNKLLKPVQDFPQCSSFSTSTHPIQVSLVPIGISTYDTPLYQQVSTNNNNNTTTTEPDSVVNLSSLQLTPAMISVLSKGLNFCPTPGEPDVYQLRLDLDSFHVNLKRKLFFAKHSDTDSQSTLNMSTLSSTQVEDMGGPFNHQKFKNPSSWCPIAPTNLEAMIAFNEHNLNEYTPQASSSHNLTKAEKEAVQQLRQNLDIVIKAADKGSAVVIQNKADYIQEGIRQLNDRRFYIETPNDLTCKHNKEVHDLVNQLHYNNEIGKTCADYLKIAQPRTSQLYLLPKIHKKTTPVPGRPIVSANNSPTERISQLVDYFLQPLVASTASYVKDTTDFINKIEAVSDLMPGTILCTIDVTSLYTNIPNQEGITACCKHLNAHRRSAVGEDQSPHSSSLMRLLEYVLTKNNFDFNDKHYLQVGGTAMGTKVAPSFANLFMAEFEEQHVYNYPIKASLWLRYIDDIFLIWEHGQEALDSLLEHLNTCHETIKFTVEHSHSSVNFLDTTVHLKNDGSLYTDLYCKPTDAHNYLAFDSAHPEHTKRSLPYSQLLRVRRICTNIDDFDKNAVMLASHFHRRGYPDNIIEQAIIDVRRKDRHTLLHPAPKVNDNNPSENLFLVSTHIIGNNPLKDIIQDNWNILGKTHTTQAIFNQDIIFGQRRNKNLKDILVRAALPQGPSRPIPTDSARPMHPCPRLNCRYCSHLDKTGEIISSSTGRSYFTRKKVSCQSNNLIYNLTCTKCNIQYVGQTKNKLEDRFVVHFNHIAPTKPPRKKAKSKQPQAYLKSKFDDPIGRHYKSTHHNGLKDVHIHILQFINAPSNSIPAKLLRDDLERKWIHRLKTLSPLGLNLAD